MCFSKLFRKELPSEQPPQEEPLTPPESTEPSGLERPSPTGIIPQSAVKRFTDKIVVESTNLSLVKDITDTNSMDPLLDKGHTVIVTNEFDPDKLVVGDIVVYHSAAGKYIVHRIIEITQDEQGRLYKLEGDNNARPDTWLIRDAHIKYLIVGIIYTKEQ